MKIAYCTNVRLPSERAHGVQIAHVCDALAALGHEVQIYAPYRKNPITKTYHQYYQADRLVQIEYLNKFDAIASPLLPGALGLWYTNWQLRRGLRRELNYKAFDLLYTRSPALLSVLLQTDTPVVLELHTIPRRNQEQMAEQCNRCARVVCLTSPMRSELIALGVLPEKIVVEPDAVDPALFAKVPSQSEAREQLGLPAEGPLIGYAGQLRSMGLSKGVEVLIDSAEYALQKQPGIRFIIAGGPEAVRQEMEASLSSAAKEVVLFMGPLEHQHIPTLLSACDILVYPAPASNHPFYQRDTSPLKLFEFMAANRPIVSADLPPLHDVVDDTCVQFVPPGDAVAMGEAIVDLLRAPDKATTLAKRAAERVQAYTWQARMQRILTSLDHVPSA